MNTRNIATRLVGICLFCFLAISSKAAACLSIENGFDIKAGETKEMNVNLSNPDDEITLVQFDLRLPAGLSLKTESGEYVFDITGRTTWRKHSLEANATDGIIRFLMASSSNTVISGTEGAIITITLVTDNNFVGGDICLENILMVTPDEKEIKQDDYVYTVGEVTSRAWLTIGGDFFISAGSEKEMTIDLTNPQDEITLVQFDLRLPQGLSLKTSNGDYVYDMADRTTWRKHSLDVNATDGTIRFLLASSSNTAISGTEGTIIRMTLVADETFKEGSIIDIENILLVSPDETEIKPADIAYTVHSGGYLKGDVNGDGKVDVADIATIISIIAGQQR